MAEPGESPTAGARFYRGTIIKLFPGSGTGIVRSESGREIRFEAPHVIISGAARRFDDLRAGLAVGFDVAWTSRGLRVSVLHVTPSARPEPAPEPSRDEPRNAENTTAEPR